MYPFKKTKTKATQMDTTALQLTLNKAREQFENGHAKACVETLKGALGDLKEGEPEWCRLRNDVTRFLSKANWLERERGYGVLSEQTYMLEGSRLLEGTMILLLDFEAAVKEMREKQKDKMEKPGTYPGELTFDLKHENTKLEEINLRISNLENIFQTHLELQRRITEIRPGSVIVRLDLYAEEIVKIKSLVKLGLLKDVISFKVLDVAWDWIDEEEFVLQLEGVNLHNVGITKTGRIKDMDQKLLLLALIPFLLAMIKYMYNEFVIYRDFSNLFIYQIIILIVESFMTLLVLGQFLSILFKITLNELGMNIIKTKMIGANLIGANLTGAGLRGADLSDADLSGADLSGADLYKANLNGANLRWAIFHINQAKILKKMNVDISDRIFIDNKGNKIESWVKVE